MPSLRWSHCLALSALAGLASVVAPLPAGLGPVLYQVALVALGAGLALLSEQDSEEVLDETPEMAASPAASGPSVRAEVLALADDGVEDHDSAGQAVSAAIEPEPEPVTPAVPVIEDPQDHFRALVQHATDVIVIADLSGQVSYASPSLHRVLGHDPDRFGGRGVLDLLHPDDEEALGDAVTGVLASGLGATAERPVRLRHGNGSWRDTEVTLTNLLDEPAVEGLVYTCRDVTERVALEERLRDMAFVDRLTGLANHASFSEELAAACATDLSRLGLLLIDLDDFRTLNDGLGHEVGDQVLQAVAGRIRSCLRPSDIPARFGQDEFAVLLPDSGREGAQRVAERILEHLAYPVALHGKEVRGTASIGVALGADVADAEALLRAGDMAMHTAKDLGKARIALFEPAMQTRAARRIELKGDMERSLERGDFLLHYQPIVELVSGRLVGMEALARWNQPGRGLVPPLEFIPLAEETGLIVRLGAWLLRQACTQLARWSEVPGGERLYMSVNLSPRQLEDPALLETVRGAVHASGLSASRFMLEITESVLAADNDRTLRDLHDLGVAIAIDDFGTGYSNLGYLRRFPLDVLKVDRSFVVDAADEGSDTRLLRGVIDLGLSLGARVVAEGIETQAQGARLLELGCGLGQGYLYSPPMDAAAMETFLRAQGIARGADPRATREDSDFLR